jgi:Arc/MetJ-type ribon-helix-helix transcriptional regulator
MTMRDTMAGVPAPLSVRLDDEAHRALRRLEATGLTRSQAIRQALLLAADRLQRADALRAEAAALEQDDADRAEMAEVAALMESLRAPG